MLNIMRSIKITNIFLFIILLAFSSLEFCYAEEPALIAEVAGKKIFLQDIDLQIRIQPRLSLKLETNPKLLNKIRISVMNSLIDRILILEEAKKGNVIDETKVQGYLDEFINGYGGREQFNLLLSNFGTTPDDYLKTIADDKRIQIYLEETIGKKISADQQELKKIYLNAPEKFDMPEARKARHILIKCKRTAIEEEATSARRKVDSLLQSLIKNPDSFAYIAKDHSGDYKTAKKGGELDLIYKGTMPKEFDEALFKLQEGEISSVIRTDLGFHIIKLEKIIPEIKGNLESALPVLEKQYKEQKLETGAIAKLQELRDKGEIKTYLKGLNS